MKGNVKESENDGEKVPLTKNEKKESTNNEMKEKELRY